MIIELKDGTNVTIYGKDILASMLCAVEDVMGLEFRKELEMAFDEKHDELYVDYTEAKVGYDEARNEIEALAKSRRDIAELCEVAKESSTVAGKDAIINLIKKEAET